jgi:small conductance mechanosensitive channel
MDPSKLDPLRIEAVDHATKTLTELLIRYGPRVATALLILIIGILIARRIARSFDGLLGKRAMEPPLRAVLVRAVSGLFVMLALLIALQNLGVEIVPLLAGLGVIGVGASLAMQGVLSNIVAGLTIIFTRPYRIGEYISINGVEGQVEEVTLFSTKLSHSDHSLVIVPNRKIVGEILHNYGVMRQLNLTAAVPYGSDLDKVLELVTSVLSKNSRVLNEPTPVIGVTMLADSSIEIAIRPWVKVADYVFAGAEIYQALLTTFTAAGIASPLPQREVRLLNAPT